MDWIDINGTADDFEIWICGDATHLEECVWENHDGNLSSFKRF